MKPKLVHWLIAAMLVANGVLFFWPQPAPLAPPDLAVPGVKQLVLLDEDAAEPTVNEEAGVPSEQQQPSVATLPVETVAEAPEPVAETATDEPVQTVAVTAGESMEPTADAEEENPPSPSAAAEESMQSPAVAEQAAELVEVPPESVAEAATPAPAPPPRCWLAGPVETATLRESLKAQFNSSGLPLNLVLERVAAEPEYWVHMPTSGTRDEVRRLRGELRREGFDNFIINDGELTGDLSLGLFRSQGRAEAVRTSLREKDYPAEIFLRPRSREEAWIALDNAALQALGWPAEEGEPPDRPDMTLRERPCP